MFMIMAEASEETTGEVRTFVHFGHSFPRRARELIYQSGKTAESLLNVGRFDCVTIEGYGGLTFRRVNERAQHYLRNLREVKIDVLSIDIGTCDLCPIDANADSVLQDIWDFLWILETQYIKPKVIVFFGVLRRTSMGNFPNQVDLETYNDRVRAFNVMLKDALRPMYPRVQFWSQDAYDAPHLIHGCHLSAEGMRHYLYSISEMMRLMGDLAKELGDP